MTIDRCDPMEEQMSLQDLFEIYDQLAPWDQYKFHVFLNSKVPQNQLHGTPVDWLIFRTQIGIEIISGV